MTTTMQRAMNCAKSSVYNRATSPTVDTILLSFSDE